MLAMLLRVIAFFPLAVSATQLASNVSLQNGVPQGASSAATKLAAPKELNFAFRRSALASVLPVQGARGTSSSLLEIEVAFREGILAMEDHSFHTLIVVSMLLIFTMMGLTLCTASSDEYMRAHMGKHDAPSKRKLLRTATFGNSDVLKFHVNLRELNTKLAADIHSNMGLGMATFTAKLSQNRRSVQILQDQECLGSLAFGLEVCLSSTGKRIRLIGDDHDDHVLTMNRETAVKFDPLTRQVQVYACRDHGRHGDAVVHRDELEVTVYPGHDPLVVLLLSLNALVNSSQDRSRQVLLSSRSL